MLRAKCIIDTKDGIKDPDTTVGHFYNVIDKSVMVMGEPDERISIIGDKGFQIDRPSAWFKEFRS